MPTMIRRKLEVTSQWGPQRYEDWYDFADWLKQENLRGHNVTIFSWQYVSEDAVDPDILRLDTRWYCQPDGGQWNIRVHLLRRLTIDTVEFCIIQGDPTQLVGEHATIQGSILLVPAATIFEEAQ